MLTLILLNPDTSRKPRTFHLEGDRPEVLGRHGKKIQLPDSRISREHAEVSVQNGTWVIRDLGSANGTWVNGERVAALCELEEGDRLQIGRLTLIVGHVEVDLAMHDEAVATEQDLDAQEPALASEETLVQEEHPTDEADLISMQAAVDDDLDALSSPLLSEPDLKASAEDSKPEVREEPLLAAVDLQTGDAVDGNAASDDSSIAPSDELHPPTALSEAEIEHLDRASFDELDDDEDFAQLLAEDDADEEDVYAESAGAITPVVARPESPLDPSVRSKPEPVDELLPEAEPENNAAPTPAHAATDAPPEASELPEPAVAASENGAEDEAPAVVGLSLDMPAPEAAEDDAEANSEAPATQGHVRDSTAEDDELALSAVAIDDDADAAIDDGMTAEFLESLDAQNEPVDMAAIAPEAVTGAAFTYGSAAPSESPEAVSELVEPEAMQDIAGQIKPRRSGWWKVAALLLVAAGTAGGWWLMQKTSTPDNIAGRSTSQPNVGDGSDVAALEPAAPSTESEPLPPGVVATQDSTRSAAADSGPRVERAQTPSMTPQVDPFGTAPTLGARDHEPVAAADSRPNDLPTPGDVNGESENATASVSEVPEVLDASATVPQADEAVEAGPVLALLDPRPQDAWEPSGVTSDVVDITEVNPVDESTAVTDENPEATAAAAAPARRIAFLADASGSMVDSMNQGVLTWLEGAIQDLNEQDQFTVVFFRSDEVFEVPPAGIKRADSAVRDQVVAWMSPEAGNIQPRGKSDPVDALRLARQYEATEIYILSDDKFGDRGTSVASVDVRDVAGFWVGQDVTFNTVQFYYEKQDDRRLQAIAKRFGGEYEFIAEPPFDRTPGVDLFGVSQ